MMEQMNKQTQKRNMPEKGHAARRNVAIVCCAAEVILALRLIFKLVGTDMNAGFPRVVFEVSGVFTKIFEGLFSRIAKAGFEPGNMIAMVVIALIALVALKPVTPAAVGRSVKIRTHKNQKTKAADYAPQPVFNANCLRNETSSAGHGRQKIILSTKG